MIQNKVRVDQHAFSPNVFEKINENQYAKDYWPIVYVLSNENIMEAYVGETTDTPSRLGTHLKTATKNKLTTVHLISSEKFNKSATLDIESNLIKYMAGDGSYKLINGNLGLTNHNYYQKKEVYWNIFQDIWNKLRSHGLVKHSLEHINNSDLFKYSPYKTLQNEQITGLKDILHCILDDRYENAIIEGSAGTGKTILAIFLFKILTTNNEDFNFQEFGDQEIEFINLIQQIKERYPQPKMALVVPMSSFRETLQRVFKNIKGLGANMVIGPAEVTRETYDILVVDESHRLRKRKGLGTYFDAFNKAAERLGLDPMETNELEWVILRAKKTILFYDENQSIKPSDVKKDAFDSLKGQRSTIIKRLKSQFRVSGGIGYVDYIDRLLNCKLQPNDYGFKHDKYDFRFFDSVENLVKEVKLRNSEHGLARVVAGFSWDWVSNKKGKEHLKDIKIGDAELKWNAVTKDWINSPNAINEVGCIHTTQGYDLNYTGIIFGSEISYDKERNEIFIIKENYKDTVGKQAENAEELKQFIVNIYKTVMLRGIKGTYVYACDPNLREYLRQFVLPFQGEREINKIEYVPLSEVIPFKNAIPIYKLDVAAGEFGSHQRVEELEWIKPPERYIPSEDLFACRVVGESMNKIIPNGSICLFRRYSGGSRNGKIVLAEYSDLQDAELGSSYTIKEYESKKQVNKDGWEHQSIVLKPQSNSKEFQNLVLSEDQVSKFKVVGVFLCVL